MTSVPERPGDERSADEALESVLGGLYFTILSKGLKLPSDIIKHLTDDEFKLGIDTFFSAGAERRANADRMLTVIRQIVLERMTKPERRRAAAFTLQHWPAPNESELPAQQTQPEPKPRTRRPSPSRLAKWEAHWQAEQGTEGDR